MYAFFNRSAARFAAGVVVAWFLLMPFMLVILGPPNSLWFLAPFLVAGVAGGVWWMRRPPAILYKPPADASVHPTGVFSKPTARFLTGFISASLIFVFVTWLTGDTLGSLSFLPSMAAVGIVGGIMTARRSPWIFSSRRPTP